MKSLKCRELPKSEEKKGSLNRAESNDGSIYGLVSDNKMGGVVVYGW
jgi:hypothetical protein